MTFKEYWIDDKGIGTGNRILIWVVMVFAIANLITACQMEAETKINPSDVDKNKGGRVSDVSVFRTVEVIGGVEYHIYSAGASDGGVHVINHTKEKLIVEGLQQQILVD